MKIARQQRYFDGWFRRVYDCHIEGFGHRSPRQQTNTDNRSDISESGICVMKSFIQLAVVLLVAILVYTVHAQDGLAGQ